MAESDLKTPPLFSLRNFFRPTSKNVLSWSTIAKGLAVTGAATSFATANAYIFIICLIIGGIADALILFTGEQPVDTVVQAIENIQEDKVIEQTNDTE